MIRWRSVAMATSLLALGLSACATTGTGGPAKASAPAKPAEKTEVKPLPKGLDGQASTGFPSTYKPLPSRATAFVGATVLTATGQQIENGVVFVSEGKITSVGGPETPIPADIAVIDAKGKWITPGIIDAHSHLGVYPSPGVSARSDGNEATDPNTAQVWSEHSVWPQDPGFNRARAGGVTTLMILPGSANLFGGRSVTLKNVPSLTMQGMKFPGAPYGLKMACGENPKRVYGGKGRNPSTAMGNAFGFRRAWIDAADYARKWDDFRAKQQKGEKADAPKRDLQLETLAGVLKGEILVQNHCYRADEMAVMIDIAKEFGYKITMFHHAIESYKLAPVLAKEEICSATWASWTGFKMESLDGIDANAAILAKNGACVVIHSDDAIMTQRLNQEAAIGMAAGAKLGINIPRAEAIKWITANPAKAMGIGDKTGSIEPGKAADLVVWSRDPFSVYAQAEQVYIDGALTYDRKDPRFQPKSDFELGQPGQGAFN
ncbi:imidazolonepropionase-like amidohydrolase [Caulobacter sp. BE264]|uniref:amidohydrolase n=1 Tax=Caulobacter sp. BE264 TaxID=2817724 RepID=UPI0028543C8A|nr:amidohydrolase [Caulobacter sp. BE264]MDR7229498.1 imidazolonepropionase-like amidohydrolase [Caulobacter sp. BE264]